MLSRWLKRAEGALFLEGTTATRIRDAKRLGAPHGRRTACSPDQPARLPIRTFGESGNLAAVSEVLSGVPNKALVQFRAQSGDKECCLRGKHVVATGVRHPHPLGQVWEI